MNGEEKRSNEEKEHDVGKGPRTANKVMVTSKRKARHFQWLDDWSGCKCGKGIPGGPKSNQRQTKSLLKIVSGYAPHR